MLILRELHIAARCYAMLSTRALICMRALCVIMLMRGCDYAIGARGALLPPRDYYVADATMAPRHISRRVAAAAIDAASPPRCRFHVISPAAHAAALLRHDAATCRYATCHLARAFTLPSLHYAPLLSVSSVMSRLGLMTLAERCR